MLNNKSGADWAQLSDELWETIFCCLRGAVNSHPSALLCYHEVAQTELMQYHSTPRVCRKWKAICARTPQFASTLLLNKTPEGSEHLLAAKCKWIAQHWRAIETIVSLCGSPLTEMALGNLLSHCIVASVPARLTTAHLSYVETGSVQALAHFDSLTNVTLDACLAGNGHLPNAKYVDLSSLGSLPSLTSLTLASGNFVQLQVLKHLTSLSVEFAQVDSVDSCQFVATLVTLVVSRSALDNFHANGISACSSLQSLQCQEGFIGAADASERMAFQDSRHHVPQSMSKLTALTALDLRFVSHRDVQLGWIAKLTSLQDVCVDVRADYVMLPMSISRLNQLTNLDISATGQIELNFDWSGLVALQSLLVQGSVKICQDLSDLAMLQALKRVLFCDMTCSDPFVTVQIGMLGHKLGATRPDVMFELEL